MWIQTVSEDEATGSLKEQYDEAIRRAGRVYNIVKSMSLKPELMKASIDLYIVLVQKDTYSLPRWVREMLATFVSAIQQCHY